MKLSAIYLERYFFEELRFKLDADFDGADEAGQRILATPLPLDVIRAEVELAVSSDSARQRIYRLLLFTDAAPGQLPYAFRACVIGHFAIGAECPDDAVEQATNANAPALLYGVAREAVAALTGRSPWPPACLPAVHFLDLHFNSAEEQPPTPQNPGSVSGKKVRTPARPRTKRPVRR